MFNSAERRFEIGNESWKGPVGCTSPGDQYIIGPRLSVMG
jgi:hypothetical protein